MAAPAIIGLIGKFAQGLNMAGKGLNMAGKGVKMASQLGKAIGGVTSNIANQTNKWMDLQDVAFKTARTMGLSRQEAMKMDRQLMQQIKEFGREYGVTAEQIAKYQEDYSQATGRNIQLTKDQIEQTIALGNITDEATASSIIDQFDTLGTGVEDALAYTGQLQERAKYLGLNAIKASKTFADNIELASSYSFKNGIDDIEKMVLKSQSLKMNMQAVMTASDKFSSIEGAIKTSANIQMLGGSFAQQFSNPMGALYESMADPAAFQERLIKTVEGKGRYDSKTGQVTFDPVTMMQMKEMANQLGIDVKELTRGASATAQNNAINQELRGNWSKDQQTAIQDLARTNFDEKTGKHFVKLLDKFGNEEKVNVEDLTEEQLKQAQDSALTQDNMWKDVHAIKETIVGSSMGRSRQNRSAKENLNGFRESSKGFFAQFENFFMPTISGLLNGGNGVFGETVAKPSIPFGMNPFYSGDINGPDMGENHFAEGGVVQPVHAAEGMVVPGDSYIGDKVPAMLNSNEMVINEQQQSGLFSLLSMLGKVGVRAFIGNKIGQKLGVGNLGYQGMAMSALSGDDMTSSMIQLAMFKKIGGLGNLYGHITNPMTYQESAKNPMGNDIPSFWDYFGIDAKKDKNGRWRNSKGRFTKSPFKQLMPKTSKELAEFNKSINATSLKFKGLVEKTSKLGNVFSKVGKFGEKISTAILHFGKNRALDAAMLGMKAKDKLNAAFQSESFGKFSKPFAAVGNFGKKVGSSVIKFGKNRALDAAMLGMKAKDRLNAVLRSEVVGKISKPFVSVANFSKKTGNGVSKIGKALYNDTGRLVNRGKALQRLTRIKSANSIGNTAGKIAKESKLLKPIGKLLGSSGGKLVGGLSKKIPIVGSLITAGMAVSDIMDASSRFDAKKADIVNSNMSEREKKAAINEATDEKHGEQGKAVGSAVGSTAGMVIGGALGTALGPIGSALGAAAGGFIGDKIGGAIGSLAKPLSKMARGFGDFLFGSDDEKTASFTDEELADPQLAEKAYSSTIKIYELMLKQNGGGVIGKAGEAITSVATAPLQIASSVLGGIGKEISGLFGAPQTPKVESLPVVGQKQTINENSATISTTPINVGPQDINLNVSGTIKLDLGGRQADFDTNKLFNSPEFKAQLAEIISRKLNDMGNGGKYNKETSVRNTQKMYNKI